MDHLYFLTLVFCAYSIFQRPSTLKVNFQPFPVNETSFAKKEVKLEGHSCRFCSCRKGKMNFRGNDYCARMAYSEVVKQCVGRNWNSVETCEIIRTSMKNVEVCDTAGSKRLRTSPGVEILFSFLCRPTIFPSLRLKTLIYDDNQRIREVLILESIYGDNDGRRAKSNSAVREKIAKNSVPMFATPLPWRLILILKSLLCTFDIRQIYWDSLVPER